jgi:ubiquitin-protein ligase
MARQRILKEAQQLASKYSFWMVSGDISHLYGRIYETKDLKYEVEIKFNKDFPKKPPELILHENVANLLGDIELKSVKDWNANSKVISIIDELSSKVKEKLNVEDQSAQLSTRVENETESDINQSTDVQPHQESEKEEYITPDLNAYPPDVSKNNVPQNIETADDFFYDNSQTSSEYITPENVSLSDSEKQQFSQFNLPQDIAENTVAINTELALLQNEYAFDQKGSNPAEVIVYLTLTLTKTFIITINFSNYPKCPMISFPTNLQKMMGDPNKSLKTLKSWNEKKPAHIVEIFRELETKLFSIKDVEKQVQKIIQEYRYEPVPGSLTKLRVHLLTYGFNEYYLDLDLQTHPDPPLVELGPQLAEIIKIPVKNLMTIEEWKKGNSEPVEVIREISWLVDKNSRIDFEVQLLKEHYEKIEFNPGSR